MTVGRLQFLPYDFLTQPFPCVFRRQMLKQKQKEEAETRPANVSGALLQGKHRQELADFEKNIENELKRHCVNRYSIDRFITI